MGTLPTEQERHFSFKDGDSRNKDRLRERVLKYSLDLT